MDNNSNNERKSSTTWRIVLGIAVSLLLVLSVIGILWAIGALNVTKAIIAATVGLALVFVVGVVLRSVGIMNNKK